MSKMNVSDQIRAAVPSARIRELIPTDIPSNIFESDVKISEDTKKAIQQNIDNALNECLTLDSQIRKLKLTLIELQSKNTNLVDDIEIQRAVLAPIRRIPGNVLRKIVAEFSSPLCITRTSDAVWRLGYVCKRWRKLTRICMPELWSNIVFEHNDISVDFFRLDRAETIAKTYIEQSSPHLITVKASLANLFHTPILDVMTSSSDRWKIAEFYGYEKDSIQKLLGVKSRVPHLQELTLRRIACTEECDAFENAPSLKRLILRDLLYDSVDSSGFQWNISMLKLPWSQIMYLTLETAMPFTSFESILRWTSSLVSLDVQDLILDVETTREKLSTDIVDSITLPAATTLFIHGRYAAPILQPLNLPNLESLYIHFGRNVHPSIPDQSLGYIADLIKRSSCIVRTLTISGTPDPMQVMGIIRAIPSLDKVRLNFEPESIQGSIFEMLHSIDNVHLTW